MQVVSTKMCCNKNKSFRPKIKKSRSTNLNNFWRLNKNRASNKHPKIWHSRKKSTLSPKMKSKVPKTTTRKFLKKVSKSKTKMRHLIQMVSSRMSSLEVLKKTVNSLINHRKMMPTNKKRNLNRIKKLKTKIKRNQTRSWSSSQSISRMMKALKILERLLQFPRKKFTKNQNEVEQSEEVEEVNPLPQHLEFPELQEAEKPIKWNLTMRMPLLSDSFNKKMIETIGELPEDPLDQKLDKMIRMSPLNKSQAQINRSLAKNRQWAGLNLLQTSNLCLILLMRTSKNLKFKSLKLQEEAEVEEEVEAEKHLLLQRNLKLPMLPPGSHPETKSLSLSLKKSRKQAIKEMR